MAAAAGCLPEDHEGREICGLIPDPTPDKGRALGRVLEDRAKEGYVRRRA